MTTMRRSLQTKRHAALRSIETHVVLIGALVTAALAMAGGWQDKTWQKTWAAASARTSIVLLVHLTVWVLGMALAGLVAARFSRSRTGFSWRSALGARSGVAAFLLVGGTLVALVSLGVISPRSLERTRGTVRAIALGLGLLLLTWPAARFLYVWMRRVTAARLLRRNARAGGFLRHALTGVALVVAATIAWLFIAGAPRAPGVPAFAAGAEPTRRLSVIAVSGVTQRQLTYWTALRRGAALERLAETGASAYFGWPAGSSAAAWREFFCGKARRRPGGARTWELSIRNGAAQALPFAASVLRRHGPAETRPAAWDLVSRAGADATVVGIAPPLARKGRERIDVLLPGSYKAVRELLDGNGLLVDAGIGGERALLRRVRDAARLPWEDWRNGAQLDGAELDLVRFGVDLGVEPDRWWEDRFRLRAFLDLERNDPSRFSCVFLETPGAIAERANEADPESFEKADLAVRAFLDRLDLYLGARLEDSRAGETIAVVFAPPAAQPSPEVATVFLFGERAATKTAAARPLASTDVSQTLYYLAGLPLAEDVEGDVAWSLLAPGARENFPPRRIKTYKGIEMMAQRRTATP